MEERLQTSRDAIGAAIGRIPSGCFVLTARHAGRSSGVLVSWVQQAAFEPPLITTCIRRGRPIQAVIREANRFLLNVIGPDPAWAFRHFAKGYSLEEDAFAGLSTAPTPFGTALTDAVAQLACEVVRTDEAGDHDLYLAKVVAGRATDTAKPYTHLRSTGFSY